MIATRLVAIAPGCERPYDGREWQGALVLVAQGALELQSLTGIRRVLEEGALLWLCDLPLHRLRAHGPETTLLVALQRRPRAADGQGPHMGAWSAPLWRHRGGGPAG